jgi:hypothetical protein
MRPQALQITKLNEIILLSSCVLLCLMERLGTFLPTKYCSPLLTSMQLSCTISMVLYTVLTLNHAAQSVWYVLAAVLRA